MKDATSHVRALVKAAFAGHSNKGGFDYYTHHLERVEREAKVYGLPQGFDTAKNRQILCSVALLHDTFEDTETSETTVVEALRKDGLSADEVGQVIAALRLMTHDPAVPYLDYVRAMRHNLFALLTKRSDLFNNMNVTELPELSEKAIRRLHKYRQAYAIVTEFLADAQFDL